MLRNHEYEVAVCGGGIAGISAALAAARGGKRVLLLEKQYLLGGLATAGLVTIYLPLCDGCGKQVSFGIAEELLRLSITYGAEDKYPENWLDGIGTRTVQDKRFQVRYNAQVFAILAEELLTKAGVDILYGTYVVGVEKAGDTVSALLVEGKSGKTAYEVDAVIDATGDCDIAFFAGAPTDTFTRGNILAGWYYYTDDTGYQLKMLSFAETPTADGWKSDKAPLVERRFGGLDDREISDFVRLGHQATLKNWLERREKKPETVLSTIATVPQFRMTRKLVGAYTLADTEMHTHFETSIGMVSDWRRRGPVYEVPFETLYCNEVKNLLVAGRCTSVNELLWDVMRVIPCCAVTGEAAGTAAALTNDFTALDVRALQRRLQENGVRLHENEL